MSALSLTTRQFVGIVVGAVIVVALLGVVLLLTAGTRVS